MESNVFTISNQINKVIDGYTHVVILGAGASKASCIANPEKNGKSIPLMNDLPKIIDLDSELFDLTETEKGENFETIFSTLSKKEPGSERLNRIEEKLYKYFETLKLPLEPTIYDYLVLSLRKKDLIATFNWDPFLWQAYMRNLQFTDNLPKLVFLHGNVAIGVCEESKTFGPNGYLSKKSMKPYKPTQLLYPVESKNYTSNSYIKSQWDLLSHFLKNPARVTIFGYSAPVSDVEAISIMKKAWGKSENEHRLTQFEIIDIQSKSKLTESWKDFIFSHHYEVSKDFFKSSIVRFPRRTGEVFEANYLEGKFYEENYPPIFKSLTEMWKWYSSLTNKE